MALVITDRVRFASAAVGTAKYPVNGPDLGYLTPGQAGLAAGTLSTWLAQTADRATWELFEGTVTADGYVTRDTIISTSNRAASTAAISWPSGSVQVVSLVLHSRRVLYLDQSGKIPASTVPVLGLDSIPNLHFGANGNWTGSFDLKTNDPAGVFDIPIPTGCMGFNGTVWALAEMTTADSATACVNVRCFDAANNIQFDFVIAKGSAHGTAGRYANFSGGFTFYNGPYPAGWRLGFYIFKNLPVGPFLMKEVVANVLFLNR